MSKRKPSLDLVSGKAASIEQPVSLTQLLRHRLAQVDEDTNATWAERLIETWIMGALKGNFRALQEILNRIEDGRRVDERAVEGLLAVDDQTTARILEVLCADADDFPSG